jgi:tungstate transport system substrate-binding protein
MSSKASSSFGHDMFAGTYRFVAALALIATILLAGVACGGATVTTLACGVRVAAVTTGTPATAAATATTAARGPKDIILATTTSTQDSGLLDVLVPAFEKASGYHVKVIAVGTGQALQMGQRGDADVLLVHAPSSEKTFMDGGYGVNRQLVMHNDFIIIGPAGDPAHVKDAKTALSAMQSIADGKADFISRGDDSGTNKFELSLWEALTITPAGQSWYEESGQGMGATLTIANQKNAYTISDRATYLAQQKNLDLVILFQGDPKMLNVYHVIQVNPDKFSGINAAGAQAFSDFMLSTSTQQLIGQFGVKQCGQQLFVPDAGKSEADVGLQ